MNNNTKSNIKTIACFIAMIAVCWGLLILWMLGVEKIFSIDPSIFTEINDFQMGILESCLGCFIVIMLVLFVYICFKIVERIYGYTIHQAFSKDYSFEEIEAFKDAHKAEAEKIRAQRNGDNAKETPKEVS